MKYFPRLVNVAMLSGCVATGAAHAQLVNVMQEGPALLLHSSQGYLGIDIRDIDNDRAAALKLKDARGAEVVTVDRDAPAGKAGLKLHDVILQMNGQQVEGETQLRRMLRETPAGHAVTFLISRDGQQQTLNIQLADRAQVEADAWSKHFAVPDPDDAPTVEARPMMPSGPGFAGSRGFFGSLSINQLYIGAEVNPVGSQLADYFGVKEGTGLLVARVDDNSPAATAGLKAGDVITKLNNDTMATTSQWLKAIHANRGKQVQLTVVRNHKEQTLSMMAGEPKKKGDLEWPVFGPKDATIFMELQAKLDSMDVLKLRQEAEALAEQSRETLRGLDLNGLESQREQMKLQMDELRQELDSIGLQ